MGNVEAKLRIKGKVFGVLVDSDKAIELKGGKPVSIGEVLISEGIYSDIKKGITCENVEKLLDVSGATARKYLDELEDENKIKQIGKTGRNVYYTLFHQN